jgi:ABC-type multidrug transport system ATPase subunit
VHAGEVLGIAGVEGNGQTELVETVMGMRRHARGRVLLNGTDISANSTMARREAGIGYVPEDRSRHALLGEQPLWANRILGFQSRPPIARRGLLDTAAARTDTERIVRDFDVRTPGIDVMAAALSGGNQQKLVVGRELSGDPVLLIAAHPTRGVDVGAQAGIWAELRRARAAGLAVLLVSADLDELIGLSDTLAVISGGRLVGTADPATVTPEELGYQDDRSRHVSRLRGAVVAPVLAIAVAALLCGVALVISGASPWTAVTTILAQVGSGTVVVDTVNSAAVYYLAALAVAIGFQMRLFNIGVEGQFRVAACVAAIVGGTVALPPVLHTVLIMVVALLTGAAWVAIRRCSRPTAASPRSSRRSC